MKKLTIRMEIESYERLKKFVEEQGKSINDVVIEAVDSLVAGSLPVPASPQGSPGQGSSPGQALTVQVPPEVLELPEAVKKLENQVAELRGCIGAMAEKLDGCVGKPGKSPVPHIPGVAAGISIAGALLQKAGGQPKDTETLLNQAKAQAEALAKKTGRRRPRAKGER